MARENSSTSSKSRSSQVVRPPKPPPPADQDRRGIGGQPRHPKHEPSPSASEALDGGASDHPIDLCPRCGQLLEPLHTIAPRVIQQFDTDEMPLSIHGHLGHPGLCPHCQKLAGAPLPEGSRVAGWPVPA